jgi:hypothetical protein
MSIATLIIGHSGTGKTSSLRKMDPAQNLLIQTIRKPLPFQSTHWHYFSREKPQGDMFVSDQWDTIIAWMHKTQRKIIVIDDFQYLLANEFMRRSQERGYDRFIEIGRHAWEVLMAMHQLDDTTRVYLLSHTEEDSNGQIKIKTIGKLLDEKITIEGLFTIVLRTDVNQGQYTLTTQNNGRDTVKSPIGLFGTEHIDNDLQAIDQRITEFYAQNAPA